MIIFYFLEFITYIMCAIRWFSTDHYSFWHGLKELIWALMPVINFTYVWDWWMTFIRISIALISEVPQMFQNL